MRKRITRPAMALLFALIALLPLGPAAGQEAALPEACQELAFSTEEDFVMREGKPLDGDPYISDGDLLTSGATVCARNTQLLQQFDVSADLGLDAADVISATGNIVAFSTELDSPNGDQFTAGDLLITNGSVIPNSALTTRFGPIHDLGLDAIHFVGPRDRILAFLDEWSREPGILADMLEQHDIDIWFSVEGTWTPATAAGFYDGDLLSAREGKVVAHGEELLPPAVPAGLPSRGVDFGLDAATGTRKDDVEQIAFSTEILHNDGFSFTDGDVLAYGKEAVLHTNEELVKSFTPAAAFLGLDALHLTPVEWLPNDLYLPLILKAFGSPNQ